MIVEQAYTSERGRRRRRQVRVDLAEVRRSLGLPGPDDRADWDQIRSLLLEAVGEAAQDRGRDLRDPASALSAIRNAKPISTIPATVNSTPV